MGNQFVLVFKRNCKKRKRHKFISPPCHKFKLNNNLILVQGLIIIISKLRKHTWFIDNSKFRIISNILSSSLAMTWKTVKKNNDCLFPRNPASIAYFLAFSSHPPAFLNSHPCLTKGELKEWKAGEEIAREKIAKETRESGGREEWAEDKMG